MLTFDSTMHRLREKLKSSLIASKWDLPYLSSLVDIMQENFAAYAKSLRSHLKLYAYTPFAVEAFM